MKENVSGCFFWTQCTTAVEIQLMVNNLLTVINDFITVFNTFRRCTLGKMKSWMAKSV